MNDRSKVCILTKRQTAAALAFLCALSVSPARAQLNPDSFTSLGTLTATTGQTVAINTTAGTITVGGTTYTGISQPSGLGNVSIFTFANINIAAGAMITVTGNNALALLSQGNATVAPAIDASGTAGSGVLGSTTPGAAILGGGNGGAGATVPGATAGAGGTTLGANGAQGFQNPNPDLGAQDGAGGGLGGPGGSDGATAGTAVGVSPKTTLVGGGGGSGGAFANITMLGPQNGAGGGAGGGAIEIVATGTLTVSNLTTNGGAGGGVQPVDGGLQYGGGGAGGALVLSGSTLTVTGSLNANGGAAVANTFAGAGGGGEVALVGTPSWVLGSTSAAAGLGVTVNVNRGVGGAADGTAGTIEATTLGVTAPGGQTATFDGTNFTNVIPVQMQNANTPAITVTLGHNLVLDGGTLQFTGANETFGPTNTFSVTNNNGTINTQGFNDTVSSQITGQGKLFKAGGGTLTLTSANTFGGGVEIDGGTVVVTNSTALGAGTLTNGAGVVMTGGTNHIITVGGDFDVTNTGTLVINLNGAPGAASNDQVHVPTGQANITGNLTINYNAAPITPGLSKTYTIITTSGGINTFGPGFTDPTVDAGAVVLHATGFVSGNNFDVTLMATQGLFRTIRGLTPNENATATYLDTVDASGAHSPGLTSLIDNLDAISISPAALAGALNQLMPLNFAHFTSSTAFNGTDYLVEQMDNYFAGHRAQDGTFLASNGNLDYSGLTMDDPNMDQGLQQIHSRLLAWNPAPSTGLLSDSSTMLGGVDMKDPKAMRCCNQQAANPWSVFVAGDVQLGQDMSNNYTNNSHDDSSTGEVRVGADYAISPNCRFGAFFNYGHTDVTLDAQNSSATIDSYMPGVYATYAKDGWYANAIGGYAFNSYTQQRNISIGSFNGSADSAPTGDEILGDLDGGYDFHQGNMTFGPTAGLKYIHLDVNGYSENGLQGADLAVNRDEADSLRSRLGGRISYAVHDGDLLFLPHLDASWVHEFMDSSRGINSQFVGVGVGTFSVSTATPSRESALVTLGLDAQVDKTFTVFTNYTVQAGQDDYFGQAVQAGVKIGF